MNQAPVGMMYVEAESAYDTDAQAYFDTLDTAGHTLSEASKTWVDNRVKNLKGQAAGDISSANALNVWSGIEQLVFCHHNAGTGTTVYAVVGTDGAITGTVTWGTSALEHASSAYTTFDFGSGTELEINLNNEGFFVGGVQKHLGNWHGAWWSADDITLGHTGGSTLNAWTSYVASVTGDLQATQILGTDGDWQNDISAAYLTYNSSWATGYFSMLLGHRPSDPETFWHNSLNGKEGNLTRFNPAVFTSAATKIQKLHLNLEPGLNRTHQTKNQSYIFGIGELTDAEYVKLHNILLATN